MNDITYDLIIGAHSKDTNHVNDAETFQYFDGLIDEVKIWNYALSEDEIKQEYNSGGAIVMGGGDTSANDDGTTVTGASTEYCIPGDTSKCSSPVLELKMDKKSGDTAYDTSGNGNDGTIIGATHSRGKKGAGLSFDGDDDWINDVAEPNIQTSPNLFTVSGYIKPNNHLSRFITPNSNGTDQWIGYNGSSQAMDIIIVEFADTNQRNRNSTSGSVPIGEWTYWAVSINDKNLKVYINGSLDSEWNETIDIAGWSDKWVIGQRGNSAFWFDGVMDDIRVFDYIRSPAQIAYDYNKGKPIAHWKFDECSGSVIHDESGNGNHGALSLGATGVTATGTCASSSDSFWYNGRDGKKNGSGSFDGGSGEDAVIVPDNSVIEPPYISFSAWLKDDDGVITGDRIISKQTSSVAETKYGYLMKTNNITENVSCYIGQGSEAVVVSSLKLINDDAWNHVLCSFDGDYLKVYVNGQLENSVNNVGSIDYTGVGDLAISGHYVDRTSSFDGQIDEVKIFNYALTAEQVKNVYNDGAVSFR